LTVIAGTVPADARKASNPTSTSSSKPNGPLTLIVSIGDQRLRVYDADGQIASSRVSTGRPGFDTPTGVFSILQKKVHHRSNIYSGAPMPYMERITWSGIALHAGVVPGFRASHGCIRLPHQFARTLYGLTSIGARVIVTAGNAEPIAFKNPKLLRPLPLVAPNETSAELHLERKLAANEPSRDGTVTDAPEGLARVIGTETARDQERLPATRAEAETMRRDKIARLQADIKEAESARDAAISKSKEAAATFAAADDELDAARRALAPARRAVKVAEKKQQAAIAAFRDYMLDASSDARIVKVDNEPGDAANPEIELENAVLNLTRAADEAREQAATMEMSLAFVQARFSVAKSARTAILKTMRDAETDLQSAQAALSDARKEMARRAKPLSVLVSLSAKRVYVRQGFEPVLEAPITVKDLPGRVGTHVFTATRYASDPNELEWQLVSAQTPSPDQASGKDTGRHHRGHGAAAPPGFNVQMATAALDAFTIPGDILATITEDVRPGASLIVSDRKLPLHENGLGTEFVLLTR
jgi:hypothetical protein